MNAIEFVREHGLGAAKEVICRTNAPYAKAVIIYEGRPSYSVSMSYGWTLISEIEELVEAFEFVGAHGNIEIAKKYISIMDGAGTSKHYDKLRKFINLVEQCNAKS